MTNRDNQIKTSISPAPIRAHRFVAENAGYVIGRRAECALSLARAEQYANENDWSTE